jgi:hypothetical protein
MTKLAIDVVEFFNPTVGPDDLRIQNAVGMFLALPDWFFGMPPVAEHLLDSLTMSFRDIFI